MSKSQLTCGLQTVLFTLKNNPTILQEIFIHSKPNPKVQEIVNLAKNNSISVQTIAIEKLDQKVNDAFHQGVVASIRPNNFIDEAELTHTLRDANAKDLILVLDEISDPQNLGACLRTAYAANVKAVILPRHNTASLTPTVRKVASGAAETILISEVTNLSRFCESIKDFGYWIVGASFEKGSENIYKADLKRAVALVMGSEGEGLRILTSKTCDFHIHIPINKTIDSLNVSVATGISIFEIRRQQFQT